MSEVESTAPQDSSFMMDFKKRFKASEGHCKTYRKHATNEYDFVSGHQLSDNERAELEEQLRATITFNRIDPVVSAVQGHQINNRQEIRYYGREQGDIKVSDVYSSAAKWIDDESDSLEEITDVFWDLAVSGMGWSETRIDYDDDPDGMVQGADRLNPLEMGWDPSATKRNLKDARYVYRSRWWPRSEAEEMWPEVKNIEGMQDHIEDSSFGQDHDASKAWMYENDQSKWYRDKADEVLIVQYQYYVMEVFWKVGDPQTKKLIELDNKKYRRLKPRLDEMGIKAIKMRRRKYMQAFIMGEHELENGDGPCKDDFTLLAMTGKRDQSEGHWYGVVRPMIDPQRWSNKFFSEMQDVMAKNRTGGAFVETDALEDPRQAEDDWNDPNPLIMVQPGALSQGKIQERNPIQYPAGIDRLMQFAVGSIPQVTGINFEMLGMVDRDQPGILEAQRKRAAMSIIAILFDSLRLHTKKRARVVLYFIKEYISDGRLIRVVSGSGKEKYVPLVKQADVKYDIVVGESPTSPDQRQETFSILGQVIPMAMQQGFPVPPSVIDYMPLPQPLIEEWKELVNKPQQDPAADEAKQLQKRLGAAEAALKESQKNLNDAKAENERIEAQLKPMEAKRKTVETAGKLTN